ncbi:acyl-CoA dehydrogenase family protein [Aeromicrobium duanguangcaii]|uniref:Acyl-CoA dehydrogenase family protein n=1 Tax=Aeromicrobium duanguangcaii TaxID=2968086 RepID=A0ABY5KDA8_9ACTN|nr:acyl-CoA dehydrogenase family protein [Aeromicrobium duanguangcaii]MCD9154498.1 acyl-CoA dehydrogenase family protein [Aeromicrobium duanguangcaii]MCL3838246.1 acyl-CoA dehydrogenase family protein [Aeromicrobium duanguangcaii]UUI68446.1 acyl-CoA dehydrogenase family protein [Aeromicrobium duanguangcaii]
MQRTLFESEHESFRDTVRSFLEKEVVPHHEQWEHDGIVPREVWLRAGELGILGFMMPEEFGGGGVSDFRYNVVLQEELTRVGASGVGFPLHTDLVSGYLLSYATDEQKQRWLPKFVTGEMITAIAMTEPGTGSDLQGMKTTAVREGDHYVLNGSKTFISNGINSDFVIVACKTDPEAGAMGVSLIAVERGMAGFERGRNLDKMGLKAQDTAELFFDNVRVPVENLIGEEGRGFIYLMEKLPQERLTISVVAAAACRTMIDQTLEYVKSRKAFGKPIGSFQNSRFVMAELETEQRIAQVFVDRSIEALNEGTLSIEDAAAGKWWTTELQKKTADSCLQLHGGYGYMSEYPISKAYLDTRIQTIYGGTTEIMKEIIGRSMGI